uniref:Ig-like domain-containing protein n=1 Tax=Pelusios castaneus TaxID=367368 RepID=A0A8C8S0F1_9SAUR
FSQSPTYDLGPLKTNCFGLRVFSVMGSPVTSTVKEGDSISLNCSCPDMDNSGRNFTWCKICHPVVSVEFPQVINIQGRTMIQIDWRSRVVRVTLTKLQLRDSGKYHCESHLQGSTTLLKMITLNVLGDQEILIPWWMGIQARKYRKQLGRSYSCSISNMTENGNS